MNGLPIENDLLCNIFYCSELDLDFVLELYEKYNVSFKNINFVNIKNLNYLIKYISHIIVGRFKNQYKEQIIKIAKYDNINYHIYANYSNSYIEFEDYKIQQLFENSEFVY